MTLDRLGQPLAALGVEATSVARLTGGVVNDVWLVTLAGGDRLVLKDR